MWRFIGGKYAFFRRFYPPQSRLKPSPGVFHDYRGLPDGVNHMILRFLVSAQYKHVTDRRTDRRWPRSLIAMRDSHETSANRQQLVLLCRWWFKLMVTNDAWLRTITFLRRLAWGTQSLLARVNYWWWHVPPRQKCPCCRPTTSGSDNTTRFSLV